MVVSVGLVVALTVISIAFALLFRAIFAVAINLDCRSRSLKTTSLFTVLSFFFPVIVGIIYAAVRDKAEVNKKACTACLTQVDGAANQCPQCRCMTFNAVLPPDAAKLAKSGVRLFILSVVMCAIALGAGVARTVFAAKIATDLAENYSEEDIEQWADDFLEEYSKKQEQSGETTTATAPETTTGDETTTDVGDVMDNLTYYDRDGKAYDAPEKVPFYDRDGNVYLIKQDSKLKMWFVKKGTAKKLESSKCFVDKDGYFYYDEKGELTQSADSLAYKDKDGNEYSPAALVIWTKDGRMISAMN
ncbi:MAG: hypothetical protein IJI47_01365 [Eubacterium sp.]|nr:hypothetical protein [Eubacterium sp.]MBR0412203.1 hypothetical protein [Eubacterium sp.]